MALRFECRVCDNTDSSRSDNPDDVCMDLGNNMVACKECGSAYWRYAYQPVLTEIERKQCIVCGDAIFDECDPHEECFYCRDLDEREKETIREFWRRK